MSQLALDRLQPVRVSRSRRWLLWLTLITLVPLSLYGWRLIQESITQKRLVTILQQIDAYDPGWRLKNLQEEYEQREVDHDLMKALQAFTQPYDDGNLYAQFWRSPNIKLTSNQLTALRTRHAAPALSSLPRYFETHRDQSQRRFSEDYRGAPGQRKALREQFEYLMRYTTDELILAVQESRGDAAIAVLQSQLALLDPFDACPRLSVQDRKHQLLITCVNNVQTMLAQTLFTEVQLARLQKILNLPDKDGHLRLLRMIRAEANDMLEQMQSDAIYRDDCLATYFNTSSGSSQSWVVEMRHNVEDWFRRNHAANTLMEAQSEVLEAFEEVMKEARRDSSKVVIRTTWPVTNQVARSVLSDNYSTAYFYANAQAILRSAMVAAACERYRLKTNHWPTSLDQLLPQYLNQVPLDPYTGKPLLFKLLPDGAAVYSVGYNLKDDGGDVLPLGRKGLSDRGVRLYDPPQRGKKNEEGQ